MNMSSLKLCAAVACLCLSQMAASGADTGLWKLSFRAGANGREIVLDSAKCAAPLEERSAAGRRLVWRGLDLESGDGAVDVVCTIARDARHNWDEYRIAVSNRSTGFGLFETEYPRLPALLKPGEGSLVRPGGCWGGQRLREKVR